MRFLAVFPAILFEFAAASGADTPKKAPPPPAMRYFIEFALEPQLTSTAIRTFMVCLSGRCMASNGAQETCAVGETCEFIRVKEITLQGSGYKYEVQNWLSTHAPHKPLKTKPLDYSTLNDRERARRSAVQALQRTLVCHDHAFHSVESTQADITIQECICEDQLH
jgi:hypothetical protein